MLMTGQNKIRTMDSGMGDLNMGVSWQSTASDLPQTQMSGFGGFPQPIFAKKSSKVISTGKDKQKKNVNKIIYLGDVSTHQVKHAKLEIPFKKNLNDSLVNNDMLAKLASTDIKSKGTFHPEYYENQIIPVIPRKSKKMLG